MSRRERKKSCNKYRQQLRVEQGEPHLRLIDNRAVVPRTRGKQILINPKNDSQRILLAALQDPGVDIVLAVGPAGTGKTLISTLAGLVELRAGDVSKFVVTRPTVGNDEDLGFLPGNLHEKLGPWTRPVLDIFDQYFTPEHVKYMMEDNKLELAPLAMMRGRTFHNCWVIADECQNTTVSQFKMLLTRIGEGSKLVVTGDLNQVDRAFKENGLSDFLKRLEHAGGSTRIEVVYFSAEDVERHPVVQEVLSIYGEG